RNGEKVDLSIKPEVIPEQWEFYLKSAEGTPKGRLISLENQQEMTPEFVKSLINERVKFNFDMGYLEGVLQNFSYVPEKYAIGFVYSGYKPVFKKDVPPFKAGDKIISVDGIKIENWLWFIRAVTYLSLESRDAYIELYGKDIDWFTYGPSDVVEVSYEDKGVIKTISLSKKKAGEILADLTLFTPEVEPYKPHFKLEAIDLAVKRCNWVVVLSWKNLFGISLFKNVSSGQVVGPVGLVQLVGTASKFGLDSVLVIVAVITMSLGVFNLLPLPALDGGRIVFALLEIITRREIDPKVEAIIHTIGFLFLLGLMIYISFMDVGRMMGM
ncbi:MAG: site-2 protease family protein, partial [Thermotogaceae bacterium]|nr:site-2 protease family protein [Thermotogaceae bacterium]